MTVNHTEFYKILRWVWRGKSAKRALLNVEIAKSVQLNGYVLDIGGKGQPSYKETLNSSNVGTWVAMDLIFDKNVSVCGDVAAIPFCNEAFDEIICFNVLEHIWDYKSALSEFRRVLKTNGILYGYVPFICNVHPDPSDFWRFTDETLKRCLEGAQFSLESIRSHGGVFISSFDLMSFVLQKLPPVRLMFFMIFLFAELLLEKTRPLYSEKYPVGYFFIARKLSPEES